MLVKVASTAVVAQHARAARATRSSTRCRNAWVDGQALRTYRHAPNTGSRKSWAAGDATSRAVRLALIAQTGEMGYPSALTAKTWGFYDVLFKGKPFKFQRPYGCYVMENVLFKISLPGRVPRADRGRMRGARCIRRSATGSTTSRGSRSRTHESAIRIIDKNGPLAQSGRPRPLHPVHGRGAADLRPAHRRGLRGRRRRRPAHRRAARRRWSASRTRSSRATTSIPRSARSPTRMQVVLQGRHEARRKSSSSIRSATAAGARKASRCSSEKFRTNLARRFPPKQQQAILDVCARSAQSSKRCRCTSSSICIVI